MGRAHPNRRTKNPTSRQSVLARTRELEAFEMRKSGKSYREIGQKLGITRQAAHQRVVSVLRDIKALTAEKAEDVRRLEIERLDTMMVGLWKKVKRGSTYAIDAAIKVMKRRSALLGLDAPTKNELAGPGGSPIQLRAEVVFVDPAKRQD